MKLCVFLGANAVLNLSGKVIGVMPSLELSAESAHNGLSELIFVPNMEDRKQKMLELSDAFIALPGGLGTLEQINRASQDGFLHDKFCSLVHIVDDISLLFEILFKQIIKKKTTIAA